MEIEERQLKEKALLLLRRERELFAMRTKHEQVTLWLRLTQLLPQLIGSTATSGEIYARLRTSLIAGLRLQRVLFLELAPPALRCIAPSGPDRPLGEELLAFLETRRSGVCNEPDQPDLVKLAGVTGLHRFLWSEIHVAGTRPVLLVAGFDRRIAPFQTPFDDSDAAHLENVAQHVQTLLGNLALVQELERERDRLQQANQDLESRDRELLTATQQLRSANESLERRVIERTEALAQRTRDMRLVLDNVDQAFLTIDAEGRLAQERSTMVDRWFGAFDGQPRFVDYVGAIDRHYADSFAVGYEALHEEVLPRDVCLAQLPSRLRSADRHFRCTYFLLPDSTAIAGLLIVISDVTEQLRREQDEAEQTELLALFQGLMRDRAGYLAFADETGHIIDQLTAAPFDLPTTRRLLHTIKGSAAMVGANVIASLCHRAEDELNEDELTAPTLTLDRLAGRWRTVTQALNSILGDRARGTVEVAREDVHRLSEEIRAGVPTAYVLARLAAWQSEPVQLPLERLAQYARALAKRLGKGELRVMIQAADIRLDPRRWGGLWSALIQVVRNAIDHGVEPPAEREARSKPPAGRFDLRVRKRGLTLVVELEDDGRGIDWSQVRAVAARRGLPHANEQELLEALYSPGFSTRLEVTATSGRGVGLAVVREQILALGGQLAVVSREGIGCCWRMSFPVGGSDMIVGAGSADHPGGDDDPRRATSTFEMVAGEATDGAGVAGPGAWDDRAQGG